MKQMEATPTKRQVLCKHITAHTFAPTISSISEVRLMLFSVCCLLWLLLMTVDISSSAVSIQYWPPSRLPFYTLNI